jgi:hypothetical protein
MTTTSYSNPTHLTQDQKHQIVDYLISYKMINSGDDQKIFKNMSAEKNRLSHYLRRTNIYKLNWDNFNLGSFYFNDSDGKLESHFTTNCLHESIIRRMRSLLSEADKHRENILMTREGSLLRQHRMLVDKTYKALRKALLDLSEIEIYKEASLTLADAKEKQHAEKCAFNKAQQALPEWKAFQEAEKAYKELKNTH